MATPTTTTMGTRDSSPEQGASFSSQEVIERIAKVFNTALISTRSEGIRDFSSEIYGLVASPAFKSIAYAVDHLSRMTGLKEKEAAEELIRTFRKLDKLWSDYVFHEGLDRLKDRASHSE